MPPTFIDKQKFYSMAGGVKASGLNSFIMACTFGEVTNGCGCVTGYSEPLLTDADAAITYPLQVENVEGDPIDSEPIIGTDTVSSPSDYCTVWNSDPVNQAIGTLYVGTGPYCFYLVLKPEAVAPSKVLGKKKA